MNSEITEGQVSSESTPIDMRRARRLLRQTVELAKHASLTGSLEGGARMAVRQYNRILDQFERSGQVPKGWFESLPEDSRMDEAGVAASQLESYFDEEEEVSESRQPSPQQVEFEHHVRQKIELDHLLGLAPFLGPSELKELVNLYISRGESFDPSSLVGLAPFLGAEELGRIIRENLPGWAGQKGTQGGNGGNRSEEESAQPTTDDRGTRRL